MIVQCPSCAAKFRVADEKIKPQGVKVRCGRCKTIFRVRPVGGESHATIERPGPGRRPGDGEATRVVHDPVAAALDDLPPGADNPLTRTGESPRGLAARRSGDDVPSFSESGLGLQPPGGREAAEAAPRAGLLEGLVPSHHRSEDVMTGGAASVEEASAETAGDGRPMWLMSGNAGEYLASSEADSAPTEVDKPMFAPPVTGEHPAGGAFMGDAPPRFEPPVESDGPRLARRDALASLADPMVGPSLDWDVEGDTAPRHPFEGTEPESKPPPLPPAPPPPPAQSSEVANEVAAALGAPPAEAPPEADSESAARAETDEHLRAITFSHRTVTRDERLAVWLGSFLAVVLVLTGFLAFVAAKNGWLLDFEHFDQMMGVAFADGTYEPRAVRTVRVYDLDGERLEAVVEPEAAVRGPGIEVHNLVQSVYTTRNDVYLLLVEGDLLNVDTQPHRSIYLAGRLNVDGEERSRAVVPVGRNLSQEELETISDAAALEGLYSSVAEEATDLVINPNQRSRFSVVFATSEGPWDDSAMSYAVEVVRTERADVEGVWHRLVFEPELMEAPTAP